MRNGMTLSTIQLVVSFIRESPNGSQLSFPVAARCLRLGSLFLVLGNQKGTQERGPHLFGGEAHTRGKHSSAQKDGRTQPRSARFARGPADQEATPSTASFEKDSIAGVGSSLFRVKGVCDGDLEISSCEGVLFYSWTTPHVYKNYSCEGVHSCFGLLPMCTRFYSK